MLEVYFSKEAFEQYSEWAAESTATFKRIYNLIKECQREPFKGTGKPEPLKHNLKGCWSRRITDEHRLVYRVEDNKLKIISCKYHYA